MAEHQLPKLTVRVRFPSPAPITKAQVAGSFRPWALCLPEASIARWAISGPLTCGDEDTSGPILVIAVVALLGLDVSVDRVRYSLVSAPRLVLVDHRGPLAVVAHPCHQVAQ
jgi:hypothetical protein